MLKPPRPYIRSSLKIDYHVDENSLNALVDGDDESCGEIGAQLIQFLASNGFKRRIVKKRRPPKQNDMEIDERKAKSDEGSVPVEHEAQTNSANAKERDEVATLGLRSVLRAISRAGASPIGAVLLDAELMRTTAVAQALALAALNFKSLNCPFFVINELSKTLAKPLNLSRITALAIKTASFGDNQPTASILDALKSVFRPITLTSAARKSLNASTMAETSSTFSTPILCQPKGKAGQPKRANKKKRKKNK